jgi:hypothetical protein
MQGRMLVFLFLALTLTEGFIFNTKPKCPIKKYKSTKYITGEQLLVHEDFEDRVDAVEKVAKDCKVHIYMKGSYYQLQNPAQQVLVTEADIVIGHAFYFEVRDESNALLCNQLCLSKNPTDMPEVKCFLQGITSRGLTWSRYNSNVISDNTYASNTQGYQTLKTDIQTKCQNQGFKRELLRALRRMYEEDQELQGADSDDNDDDKKEK